MRATAAATLASVASLFVFSASVAQDVTPLPRGFSLAEQPAPEPAACATLATSLAALQTPRTRIDLTVLDKLTLVHGDGALTYLAVCSEPGPRVLCVAYSANGMRVGDRAVLRGGYNRQDATHVVLDPCLASRAE